MKSSISADILILKSKREPPRRLVEALQKRGFETRITEDYSQAQEICSKLAKPVIISYSDGNPRETDKQVGLLGKQSSLFKTPLILMGASAANHESRITKIYEFATTINTPCDANAVIELISLLVQAKQKADEDPTSTKINLDHEEKLKTKDSKSKTDQKLPLDLLSKESISSENKKADPLNLESKERLNDKLNDKRNDKPDEEQNKTPNEALKKEQEEELAHTNLLNKVFDTQNQAKLISSQFAIDYARGGKISAEVYPTDPLVLAAINDVKQKHSPWVSQHLERVSYVSSEVCKILELPDNLSQALKSASFLYLWGLDHKNQKLLKQDYSQAPELKAEICSRLKDSALKITHELKAHEASSVIVGFAKLANNEQEISNDDISKAASLLLCSDLINRMCFYDGHWSPRHAHRLIRQIGNNEIENIHPSILPSMIKLLTESSNQNRNVLTLNRRKKNDDSMQKTRLADYKKQPLAKNEKRMPVSELQPGMILSKPILTFDGEELLESDTILDRDLIWRIWRLSVICPLNPLTVISGVN